jgi:mono/diheme cytochrome c family protein
LTFLTKSILALALSGFALLNFISMMGILGRSERKFDPKTLRLVHGISGICWIILSVVLSYYCIKIMRASGQELGPRSALHGLLSVAVFLILALKISFVRIYRKFFSAAAVLGIGVVILTLCTTALSAGYYLAVRAGKTVVVQKGAPAVADLAGSGSVIFQKHCAGCHYSDKTETKMGPGLKGLFRLDKLPVSGKPVTEANVVDQLTSPVGDMPSFPELTDEEKKALVGYLRAL